MTAVKTNSVPIVRVRVVIELSTEERVEFVLLVMLARLHLAGAQKSEWGRRGAGRGAASETTKEPREGTTRGRIGILVILEVNSFHGSGDLRRLVVLPRAKFDSIDGGGGIVTTLLVLVVLDSDVAGCGGLHGLVTLP